MIRWYSEREFDCEDEEEHECNGDVETFDREDVDEI